VEYAAAGNGAGPTPAARRAPGGRAGGADLFRGAAQAGGEEEVLTSAPHGAPQQFEGDKPAATTGARNENSVLFSLSALTSKGSERPPAVPGAEASGLIDIRQLSAQMGKGDDKKRSRVDDIMNLSSGGAFNGALNAPMLSAPAMDQISAEPAHATAPPRAGKGIIFLAVGAAAFVIVAAVGATFMLTHKDTDATAASASASAGAPSATMAATGTAAATTTATASATAESTAGATASAAPTDTVAAAAPTTTTTAAATTAAAAAAAAPPVAPTPRPQAAPVQHAAAPAAAPAAAAAEGGGEFNMGEAKSRLAAAAAAAQGCKKGDGPTGTGRVVVVFAPNGGAQSANVSGPPFEGTPTGACVAARFKGVRVPAFSGSPFSVSKSFTIN
jgi:hypothetical protein